MVVNYRQIDSTYVVERRGPWSVLDHKAAFGSDMFKNGNELLIYLRSGGKKQINGVKQQKKKKKIGKRSEPSGGLGKCKGWWCLETYL